MAPLFRWTSARHLRGRPSRTALTIAGVAAGVAVVVAVGLVNDSVVRGLRRASEAVSGHAALVITGDRTGIPADVLERVRALPGVDLATPILQQVTAIRAANGRPARGLLLVLGLDLLEERLRDDPDAREATLRVPDPIALFERSHSLVLAEPLARELGIAGSVPSAKLTLGTPDGLRPFDVLGVFEGGARLRDLGARVALMDYESAAKAFGKVGRVDQIRVRLREGTIDSERDAIAAGLRAMLGAAFEVERPQNRGQPAERVLATWQSGLSLIALLSLLVGMFLAYQAVSVAVAERRQEIGILRALGASRGTILRLFLSEAALIGAIGSAIGAALGVLLAQGLLAATGQMIQSYVVYVDLHRVVYDPLVLSVGAASGVLAAIAAGVAPATAAARATPVDALSRFPPRAPKPRARVRALAGIVVLGACGVCLALPSARAHPSAAGILLIGVIAAFLLLSAPILPASLSLLSSLAKLIRWRTLELALHAARRAPHRALVTVNVVAVGFGLVLSTASLARSFEGATLDFLRRSIPADLIVTCGTELYGPTSMPMPSDFARSLSRIAGVAEVQSIRYADARLEGARVDVLSFDTAAWSRRGAILRALEGSPEAIVRGLMRGEGVAVSENLARAFRVRAGQSIALRTPSGERRYTVLGVVADYSSPFGVVSMDRALFRAHFGDDRVDQFHVFTEAGVDPALVREHMRALAAERDVFVLTSGEVRARIRRLVRDSFAIVRIQEVVALLVTLFGLASLLFREVLYRTREIGILRALGASRARVATLVTVESVALAATGGICGVALGAALSVANIEAMAVAQMGWRFPYAIPWPMLAELFACVLAVSVLAAILPARHASRIVPSAALREP